MQPTRPGTGWLSHWVISRYDDLSANQAHRGHVDSYWVDGRLMYACSGLPGKLQCGVGHTILENNLI